MITTRNIHYPYDNKTDENITTIKVHYTNLPYLLCEKEIKSKCNNIYRLLSTIDTWVNNTVDNDSTDDVLNTLTIAINKSFNVVVNDIEVLINNYNITDDDDINELKDNVVQLKELVLNTIENISNI